MGALTIIATGTQAVLIPPTDGPSSSVWSDVDQTSPVTLPATVTGAATFWLQDGSYTVTVTDPFGTVLHTGSVAVSVHLPVTVAVAPLPTETVAAVAASGATQTVPDPATATINEVVLTAACTLTFPAPAAGSSFTLLLTQDSTGGRTVTWPSSVAWPSAATPTLTATANKTDVFSFLAVNDTTWLGFISGQAF
jgi:hypothetical protein